MGEEVIEKKDILLRNVPMSIIAVLEKRAERNYRSVTGEVLAILTAVTLGGDTLPGLGVGEVLPSVAADGTGTPCAKGGVA